jgi:hypothetical protein
LSAECVTGEAAGAGTAVESGVVGGVASGVEVDGRVGGVLSEPVVVLPLPLPLLSGLVGEVVVGPELPSLCVVVVELVLLELSDEELPSEEFVLSVDVDDDVDDDPSPSEELLSPCPFRLSIAWWALWPALPPRLSRTPSAMVCGVFLSWSTAASEPALRVWPTSMPFWAPKLTFRDWEIRSVMIASRAEIAGSFIASTIASMRASLSSLRSRRTIIFVACVAPAAPSSDRPKVKGAAAWAAMISAARIASWTITAALAAITMAPAASSTPATTRATVWASSR